MELSLPHHSSRDPEQAWLAILARLDGAVDYLRGLSLTELSSDKRLAKTLTTVCDTFQKALNDVACLHRPPEKD